MLPRLNLFYHFQTLKVLFLDFTNVLHSQKRSKIRAKVQEKTERLDQTPKCTLKALSNAE